MNNAQPVHARNPGDYGPLIPPDFGNRPVANEQALRDSGWLCGFRVDNMEGPQALNRQVASYVDGAVPAIEQESSLLTEVITTHSKRESNYVHHGWSVGAVETISPWTLSRIHATNRRNQDGTWITRRTLAQRLRARILLDDLVPVPEFEAAIEEALEQPTQFEKFRAIYCALNRWGDVVPLLPSTICYNSLSHLSRIGTANLLKKGAASNAGWDDGAWTTMDVPTTEWRPIRILAVAPTFSLLSDETQIRLASLHDERLLYVPPLTVEQISWPAKMHDDMNHASRTISQVVIRSGDIIVALSVTYLDGTKSGSGGSGGNEQTFALTEGEHVVEMLTCADDNWLHAIQFITNKGRCSAIYGKAAGVFAISRSEGGILAGFSISTRQHPEYGYMVTGVNGIWRHDLIPRAPKERDVYSDYIKANKEFGKGFNDRALIGNSSSAYVSAVEVRAHGVIHSIEFTYTDTVNGNTRKFKSPRHGGSHGPYFRFDLERGEHIVSVTGKYGGDWVAQLCFGTNLGRMSDVYGEGGGQAFSVRAPLGEDGRSLRLQYVLGKCEAALNGVMFVWTPGLPP